MLDAPFQLCRTVFGQAMVVPPTAEEKKSLEGPGSPVAPVAMGFHGSPVARLGWFRKHDKTWNSQKKYKKITFQGGSRSFTGYPQL